ncbi:hypothetical protein C8Q76DRAFT_32603 [Earliella scabrosa]|nr:hypothetical protein C8Q76DRAFT_32603 [Earliella scabrosa]
MKGLAFVCWSLRAATSDELGCFVSVGDGDRHACVRSIEQRAYRDLFGVDGGSLRLRRWRWATNRGASYLFSNLTAGRLLTSSLLQVSCMVLTSV